MALDQTIVGKKFGRLLVTDVVGQKNGKTFVKVLCDCGTVKEISRGNLANESRGPKSCGCMQKENIDRIKKTWKMPIKK